jgi:hypothetical protein
MASKEAGILTDEQVPCVVQQWKPIPLTGLLPGQLSPFIVVPRIQAGSNMLERQLERLHAVDAMNFSMLDTIWPVYLVYAYEIGL